MNPHRFIAPVVVLVVLSGLSAVAFLTRESWVAYVFLESPKPTSPDPHAEPDAHDHLSDSARKNLKLEVGRVAPRPYWRTIQVPGVVVERPGETERAVTTRLGGVVTKVSAKPGDRMTPGQRLFTIEPTGDILRTQVELATAMKDLAIYTTAREGVARQVAEKTRPANDLVEPQKQVSLAANQVDGLKGQLRAWKLTDAQMPLMSMSTMRAWMSKQPRRMSSKRAGSNVKSSLSARPDNALNPIWANTLPSNSHCWAPLGVSTMRGARSANAAGSLPSNSHGGSTR